MVRSGFDDLPRYTALIIQNCSMYNDSSPFGPERFLIRFLDQIFPIQAQCTLRAVHAIVMEIIIIIHTLCCESRESRHIIYNNYGRCARPELLVNRRVFILFIVVYFLHLKQVYESVANALRARDVQGFLSLKFRLYYIV